MQVTVKVNDQNFTYPKGTSISDLLQKTCIDKSAVAVDLNKKVIPRSLHDSTYLKDGDEINLIEFIGGG